jgi:predicted amidophosphoribosyltransferase
MKLDFKKIKKFIYIVLLFMPMVVFADSGDSNDFGDFLMVHVFLTFFSYMTIVSPLALILKTDKESQKEMEKTLFWVRVIIIIAIGMFAPGFGLAFDIISIFIGAFILVPKSIKVSSSREESTSVSGVSSIVPSKKVCPKCNSLINSRDLFCIKCGERFESLQNIPTETYTCPKCKRKLPPGNNFCIHCGQSVEISQAMVNKTLLKCAACNKELLATDVYCTNCGQPTKFISSPINKETLVTQDANAGTAVDANNFAYYAMDEDKILTTIIKDEIKKNGVNIFVSVKDLEKRKTVLTTLYAVILFIFISLLFFHTKIFEMFIIMLIVSYFSTPNL